MNRMVLPNSLMLGEVSELLSEGRDVVIMTKGVSMRPFIEGDRDSVLLRAKSPLEVGDIALAQVRKGVYVLHRVRRVSPEEVLLKGDGNLRGTESCRPEDVSGVVMEIIHPDESRQNPYSPWQKFRWKCWKLLPCIGRRGFLWIYRKLKKH